MICHESHERNKKRDGIAESELIFADPTNGPTASRNPIAIRARNTGTIFSFLRTPRQSAQIDVTTLRE